ncbi:MAG: recombinase family protein [Nanoarchaeota archaeon]|nr:recombinase family protein [Nanoarchaeota archaeon]
MTSHKIAIYLRVSTKEQSEEEQLPLILKEFDLNLDDVVIFRDEVSAWNLDKESKRKEFLELKKQIFSQKISLLYIWDLDRLYRNRLKTKEFFTICEAYKCKIYSVNQKWLNEFQELKNQFPDNFKFLIDNIHGLLLDVYSQSAQDESDRKSKRVKLKVVKKEGKKTKSVYGKNWGRKAIPKQTVDKILNLHEKGYSIRKISSMVQTTDKNNNMKNVSRSTVHKTILENSRKKDSI